jgi:hypothetical protein
VNRPAGLRRAKPARRNLPARTNAVDRKHYVWTCIGGEIIVNRTQHEVWDVQEHIRGTAASAQVYAQLAQSCTDPDLQQFCAEESRMAAATVKRLMSLIQQDITH